MSDYDILLALIERTATVLGGDGEHYSEPPHLANADEIADAIIAAGFRREQPVPETATSDENILDDLTPEEWAQLAGRER